MSMIVGMYIYVKSEKKREQEKEIKIQSDDAMWAE